MYAKWTLVTNYWNHETETSFVTANTDHMSHDGAVFERGSWVFLSHFFTRKIEVLSSLAEVLNSKCICCNLTNVKLLYGWVWMWFTLKYLWISRCHILIWKFELCVHQWIVAQLGFMFLKRSSLQRWISPLKCLYVALLNSKASTKQWII